MNEPTRFELTQEQEERLKEWLTVVSQRAAKKQAEQARDKGTSKNYFLELQLFRLPNFFRNFPSDFFICSIWPILSPVSDLFLLLL